MSFLETVNDPLGITAGISGQTAGEASQQASAIQVEAAREARQINLDATARAQEFFEPFAGSAARGLEASQFLADPEAQFDFLQNSPLVGLARQNALDVTGGVVSTRDRLSAGDTLDQLNKNILLSANPIIDRQREDVTTLLNLGTNIAGSQANIETGQAARISDLTTGIGAAQAAGNIGEANAQAAGAQNVASIAGAALSFFCDERLKENVKSIGFMGDNRWYSWKWNKRAEKELGLHGTDRGVIAQEVKKTNPDAVTLHDSGYYKVNYGAL